MQPVNPAAYTNAFPRIAVWVDICGLEPPHIWRRYRHGEISAPVLAKVQIGATATHLGIHHPPFDDLEAAEIAPAERLRRANPILWKSPQPDIGGPCLCFGGVQLPRTFRPIRRDRGSRQTAP